VNFLQTHQGEIALVTIDLGGNDLLHLDAHGNAVYCPLQRHGCGKRVTRMADNLAMILTEVKAAAGPRVPIVGMTYDDVIAPRCDADRSLMPACRRFDAFNRRLAAVYRAAHVPVADVGAAFENDDLAHAAQHVCAWTWFCSRGDFHPDTTGYGVITHTYENVVARVMTQEQKHQWPTSLNVSRVCARTSSSRVARC